MIINRFNERARWFRCKDGTAAMVVNHEKCFTIVGYGFGGVPHTWGMDIPRITSDIGPVDWPAPELPPLDLSGWEVGVEHLVKCRDGKRRMAVRNDFDLEWPILLASYDSAEGIDRDWLRINGRFSDKVNNEQDIIADYGPLGELELKEVER